MYGVGSQDGYVALGFEVDASFAVVLDAYGDMVARDSADIDQGGQIATAHYRIYPLLAWAIN